jgi:hypothetical protein
MVRASFMANAIGNHSAKTKSIQAAGVEDEAESGVLGLLAEARNQAVGGIFDAERSFSYGPNVPKSVRVNLERAVAAAKEAVKGADVSLIVQRSEALGQAAALFAEVTCP